MFQFLTFSNSEDEENAVFVSRIFLQGEFPPLQELVISLIYFLFRSSGVTIAMMSCRYVIARNIVEVTLA